MNHKQHRKLPKPNKGFYSRNEISILGSNCNRIKTLAKAIGNGLKEDFYIAYIDADHASHNKDEPTSNTFSFAKDFTDKITHYQYNIQGEVSDYEKNAFFNAIDLTIVNGNHEKANHQIVIIDINKEASLVKRAAALTNVIALVVLDTNDTEIPTYIKDVVPEYSRLPLFLFEENTGIIDFAKSFLENKRPAINGLIFGGGKSTRMGTDKVFIQYHGVPQHTYLENLMHPFCEEVFVSCRADQASLFNTPLTDSFLHLGAYGGLLSSFQKDPNTAWMAIACDIPLLTKETIAQLVENRNPSKMATCFYNSETDFPEPLITIWEPKAYPILLHYLSLGYSCTRKVLINNDVEIIKLENEDVLLNANTPKEQKAVLGKL